MKVIAVKYTWLITLIISISSTGAAQSDTADIKKKNMNKPEVYTVITGASSGLGKSLAIESAKKGRNLILVALPFESVSRVAYELENF